MTRERIQGHLCILAANVIFGIYIPISKYVLGEFFSGEVLTVFRMWGATLLFWVASLWVKNDHVNRRDLLLMLVFGVTGIVLNQGLFICGLSMTSPVDASVIVTSTPLMVMIISALLMHDPITRRKGLGVFMGASGAIWLILSTSHIHASTGTLGGDTLILISGFSTAIYYSLSKPLTSRHSPITLMKWMFLFSSLVMLPLTPHFFESADAFKNDFTLTGAAALIYIIIGATFTTYLLIAMAIKRMRPTTMAMYNYLQPFISSSVAVIVGQDSFSIEKCCAAVLVFSGVYLVTSAKSPSDIADAAQQLAESKARKS